MTSTTAPSERVLTPGCGMAATPLDVCIDKWLWFVEAHVAEAGAPI